MTRSRVNWVANSTVQGNLPVDVDSVSFWTVRWMRFNSINILCLFVSVFWMKTRWRKRTSRRIRIGNGAARIAGNQDQPARPKATKKDQPGAEVLLVPLTQSAAATTVAAAAVTTTTTTMYPALPIPPKMLLLLRSNSSSSNNLIRSLWDLHLPNPLSTSTVTRYLLHSAIPESSLPASLSLLLFSFPVGR